MVRAILYVIAALGKAAMDATVFYAAMFYLRDRKGKVNTNDN